VLDHYRSQREPGRSEAKAPAAAAGRVESVLRVD
jgi:hypothetical protein